MSDPNLMLYEKKRSCDTDTLCDLAEYKFDCFRALCQAVAGVKAIFGSIALGEV